MAQAIPTTAQVFVDNYLAGIGWVSGTPTATQDTAAINAAITDASVSTNPNYGAQVIFGGRHYTVATTITITAQNLVLQGVGFLSQIFKHPSLVGPVFLFQGASNAFLRGNYVNDLVFSGANLPEDVIDVNFGLYFRMNRCFFSNGGGNFVNLSDTYDSKIDNCDFQNGGLVNGHASLQFQTTNASTSANNIYISNCRFETFAGVALRIASQPGIGNNNNNFFIDACKFESNLCNGPYLECDNGNQLIITSALFYFAAGTSNAVINFQSFNVIKIAATMGAARGAHLSHYVALDTNSGAGLLELFINDIADGTNVYSTPTLDNVVSADFDNAVTAMVYGYSFNSLTYMKKAFGRPLLPLTTGPSGGNPVQDPASQADINALIITLNAASTVP